MLANSKVGGPECQPVINRSRRLIQQFTSTLSFEAIMIYPTTTSTHVKENLKLRISVSKLSWTSQQASREVPWRRRDDKTVVPVTRPDSFHGKARRLYSRIDGPVCSSSEVVETPGCGENRKTAERLSKRRHNAAINRRAFLCREEASNARTVKEEKNEVRDKAWAIASMVSERRERSIVSIENLEFVE
ncbi:hypothetical protein WN48_11064 [Eufriesea mexicana]|uniref:Uncharacterized protein n=1 Tax=Eufriesea mexicana TaxID=516756 RepID=A0A310S8L5_9HYME|nr:hypothetical protein WN48_11064 [Eufriesea mexicana]